VLSCTQILAPIGVSGDAPLGAVDLVVRHSSGVTGVGAALLLVTPSVDQDGPPIGGLGVHDLTATTAVVSWFTDEPADSRVFVRKQGLESYQLVEDAAAVTQHALSLAGLEPETVYEFHVTSTDAAGNATATQDATFLTLASSWEYLRLEAESGALTAPVQAAPGPGAFGGAWVATPPDTGQGTSSAPIGHAHYGVWVPEPGTWFLWVRLQAADAASDSWFESVGGAALAPIATSQHGAWSWAAGRSYVLAQGLHVVELAGHEPGARADRLLLTNDPDFVPTESPDADVTAPGPVQNLATAPAPAQLILSWLNPSSPDLARIELRYRTDGQYPGSPADGLPLLSAPALPGAPGQHVHAGVVPGTMYHYAAFAVDAAGNVSVAAHAVGGVAAPPPPPQNLVVD
jgi:hypothetical protein